MGPVPPGYATQPGAGYAPSMYPVNPPSGFSVVVHGSAAEPYAHPENGPRSPPMTYNVPYGREAHVSLNDPYAPPPPGNAMYNGARHVHDEHRVDPSILPMYVNPHP